MEAFRRNDYRPVGDRKCHGTGPALEYDQARKTAAALVGCFNDALEDAPGTNRSRISGRFEGTECLDPPGGVVAWTLSSGEWRRHGRNQHRQTYDSNWTPYH
jgi:hypothetical protein